MKYALSSLLLILLVGSSWGGVSLEIRDPNGFSKYPYQKTMSDRTVSELMVGHAVSVMVVSDVNDLWSGGVFLRGNYRGSGTLHARNKDADPNSRDWTGSHLSCAGIDAVVTEWRDSAIWGFDLYNDAGYCQPGEWFVLDYTATKKGICDLEFYDYDISFTVPADPNTKIQFVQIPTRDFNNDKIVNLIDFQLFSRDWQIAFPDPNSRPDTDIDDDGFVGIADLAYFSEYWLWGIPKSTPAVTEPNDPNITPEAIYSILAEPNAVSEITLLVGESITLYIHQETIGQDIYIFDLEVNISDPNLGWIDNDPNGSAQILVYPRWEYFDMIQPGFNQPEGIEFLALSNLSGPLQDGYVVSFEYTAAAPGDVYLTLFSHLDTPLALEPILIHQVQPLISAQETISTLQSLRESGELSDLSDEEWDSLIESIEQTEEESY